MAWLSQQVSGSEWLHKGVLAGGNLQDCEFAEAQRGGFDAGGVAPGVFDVGSVGAAAEMLAPGAIYFLCCFCRGPLAKPKPLKAPLFLWLGPPFSPLFWLGGFPD